MNHYGYHLKENCEYRKNITTLDEYNKEEFYGQTIDIFEDFLDERGIIINNNESEEEENKAIIYGSDYDELHDKINDLIVKWNTKG